MRTLLILALMLLTPLASAEWVKYAEADGDVVYYDPATIRRERNFRRVWGFKTSKIEGEVGSCRAVVLNGD
jgi:hypothetical protein